jgi:hypothetical protein
MPVAARDRGCRTLRVTGAMAMLLAVKAAILLAC